MGFGAVNNARSDKKCAGAYGKCPKGTGSVSAKPIKTASQIHDATAECRITRSEISRKVAEIKRTEESCPSCPLILGVSVPLRLFSTRHLLLALIATCIGSPYNDAHAPTSRQG